MAQLLAQPSWERLAMGFDLAIFVSQPDQELICPICQGVLEDPVEDGCQHIYCQTCLEEWMKVKSICPFTREPILHHRAVPLALHNMIDGLKVRCPLAESNSCGGSIELVKYPDLCSQCFVLSQGGSEERVERPQRRRFVGRDGREGEQDDSIFTNDVKYALGGIAVAGTCGFLVAFNPGLGIRAISFVRTIGFTAIGCALASGIEMALSRIRRDGPT